jgi:hypothetical protein
MAGAPGFEPGNGGIKIHLVCKVYQSAFRKFAEIRPKSYQEVTRNFGMSDVLASGKNYRQRLIPS